MTFGVPLVCVVHVVRVLARLELHRHAGRLSLVWLRHQWRRWDRGDLLRCLSGCVPVTPNTHHGCGVACVVRRWLFVGWCSFVFLFVSLAVLLCDLGCSWSCASALCAQYPPWLLCGGVLRGWVWKVRRLLVLLSWFCGCCCVGGAPLLKYFTCLVWRAVALLCWCWPRLCLCLAAAVVLLLLLLWARPALRGSRTPVSRSL